VELVRVFTERGYLVQGFDRTKVDISDAVVVEHTLAHADPAIVLNAAAYNQVDVAENEPLPALVANGLAVRNLAMACRQLDARFVHFSTDYVFDGACLDRAYRETDPTGPLCWYAETKLEGEQGVLGSSAQACVARIEMPFSAQPHRKQDLARLCLARLGRGEPMVGVVDQRITPIFLDDAVRALGRITEAHFTGTIHVAAAGWTTPFAFIQAIAARLGLNADLVERETFADFGPKRPARRPQHSWLDVSCFEEHFGRDILRAPDAELDAWAQQVSAT